jgi:hypothetical protein
MDRAGSEHGPRLVGGVSLTHPGAPERMRGDRSVATLMLDRRLKSGKVDTVVLTEDDLLRLIETAARALRTLRDRP